jgi:hypothetical protein
MIYENIVDLVEDASLEIDPEDLFILDEGVIGSTLNTISAGGGPNVMGAVQKAGRAVADTAAEKFGPNNTIGDAMFKAGNYAAANPETVIGASAAVIALAGAAAVYKYFHSIWRLKKVADYYSKKAAAEKNPTKKGVLVAKAKKYTESLKLAQAKARKHKQAFIDQTKSMEQSYAQMKKSDPSGPGTVILGKKLQARQKIMSKIGAM